MNKLFTIILTLGMVLPVSSQSQKSFKEIFSKYANRKDAFSLTLNKEMLNSVDLDIDFEDHMRNVSGDIHQIKFIMFGEHDEGRKIVKSFSKDLRQAGFPRIPMEVEDSDLKLIKIYGKKKKGFYRVVHILVLDEDHRAFFISIRGKLKVKYEA